ncbi:hypothetical protein RCC89_04425 [Cytophagaceae bacterium ABcell3]|nr:hypothetical protein RCC89_04425 [Cytophagaceae bacterium ABcell3]
MKKNKALLIIALLFTGLMIYLTIDMANRTVKPWDKNKNNVMEKYKVK